MRVRVIKEAEVITLEDGNWYKLPTNCMYQKCCECGSVHWWEFKPTETGMRIKSTALTEEEVVDVEGRVAASKGVQREGVPRD